MYICWKCTHPQAIEDADEFVSSDLEKCMLSSEWVPSEWEYIIKTFFNLKL